MATRNPNPVHAYAKAVFNHGYGHVNIHIYELFGYNGGTLKISCQSGGNSSDGKTYAWEYGVSKDHSVLGLHALREGYWLMRRVERALTKEYDERGRPETYADFALRVLRAVGVRRVHVNSGVNAGFSGDMTNLPTFDPRKQGDALFSKLQEMEQDIINRRY